jgi:ABC-type antimicrobial peptide transport system permease subunit
VSVTSVISLTYLRSELGRRRGRTILTVSGVAMGVALVLLSTALVSGLDRAQASVLTPLAGVGSDMLVTRTAATAKGQIPSSSDLQALQTEEQAAAQAALIDLSHLGKPGTRFVHDFFLPPAELTFPDGQAAATRALPGVVGVASALTLVANHRQGTVPEIVSEMSIPSQTVTIAPPTPAEDAQINACVGRLLPRPTVPSPGQSPPQIVTGPPAGMAQCLPKRFRQFMIPGQVLREVIAPPQTDITTTTYAVTGLDLAVAGLGPITRAQVTEGAFLDPASSTGQAMVTGAFATRSNLHLGSSLTINGTTFAIVGLVTPPLGGHPADVYLSLPALQALAGRGGRVNALMVRADRAQDVDRVAREIRDAFPGAQVTTAADLARQVSGSLLDATTLADRLGVLIALVVLAAGFGVAAAMTLASVGERVRELGTLRAIGWRRGAVVRQVLAEALAQGLIGALAGVALGFAIVWLVSTLAPPLQAVSLAGPSSPSPFGLGQLTAPATGDRKIRLEAIVDAWPVVVAITLCVAGGLLSGAAGAVRSARLRPADALRELG